MGKNTKGCDSVGELDCAQRQSFNKNKKASLNKPTIEVYFDKNTDIMVEMTTGGELENEVELFRFQRLPTGTLFRQDGMTFERSKVLLTFLMSCKFTDACQQLCEAWRKEIDISTHRYVQDINKNEKASAEQLIFSTQEVKQLEQESREHATEMEEMREAILKNASELEQMKRDLEEARALSTSSKSPATPELEEGEVGLSAAVNKLTDVATALATAATSASAAPSNAPIKVMAATKLSIMTDFDEKSVLKLDQDWKHCENNTQAFSLKYSIDEEVRGTLTEFLQINKSLTLTAEATDKEQQDEWMAWNRTKLIGALRKLLNMQDEVDSDGCIICLKLVKLAANDIIPNGIQVDTPEGQTAAFKFFTEFHKIVMREVSETARGDSSEQGPMKAIREFLFSWMGRDRSATFGSGMVSVLRLEAVGASTWKGLFKLSLSRYQADLKIYTSAQRLCQVVQRGGGGHQPSGGGTGKAAKKDLAATRNLGKRDQPSGGKPDKPGKQDKQPRKPSHPCCRGCGKHHDPTTCYLKGDSTLSPPVKQHPDYNLESCAWKDSTKGKAWAAKSTAERTYTSLPCRKTLDGTPYTCHPNIPGKGMQPCMWEPTTTDPTVSVEPVPVQCMECNSVNTSLSGDTEWNRTTMYVKSLPNSTLPPLRLDVLLDSGSEGAGGNYISKKVGDELRLRGYKGKEHSRTVCSCFADDCRKLTNEFFKIRLTFTDQLEQIQKDIIIECVEMNITHDMIVGYETINLQQALRNGIVHQLQRGPTTVADQPKPDTADEVGDCGSSLPSISKKDLKQSKVMRDVKHKRAKLNTTETSNPSGTGTADTSTAANDKVEEYTNMMRIDGDDDMQNDIRKVVSDLIAAFSTSLNREHAKITPMDLKFLPDSVWHTGVNAQPPRQQSRLKAEEILAQVDKMLKAGIIRASKARSHSQVMMTPKKDGTWRFCVDFRRLNVITEPNRFPLPRIDHLLKRLGEKHPKFFAVLDLTKGYYQAPLSEASKILTAFITPHGLYEWNRVAMGLTGAPGYFQRAMASEVLQGDLLYQCCELYLDDIVVFGATKEEFLANLRKVLQRLIDFNVTLNPNKCQIGLEEVEYVGHTVSAQGTHFSREKLQKVIDFTRPKTGKQLRSFLGLANYFREHVNNHSSRVEPLTRLLDAYDAKKTLDWTDAHTKAFEDVQKGINDCPMLFFVDTDSPVHLYTDASDVGIGGYLCQVRDGKEIPIAFYSKSLTKEEKKWGTPALEGYAIRRAFEHFDYLLRDSHTYVHTDHLNLIYIKDSVDGKVIRWKLALQEYSFELMHVKGVDNPIGDYMSRNEAAEMDSGIIDEPRKAINMLNTMSTHYMEGEDAPCCQNCADKHKAEYMVDIDYVMQVNSITIDPECGLCNVVNNLNALGTGAQFSIPPDAYQAILNAHDERVGHHGVEATLTKLDKMKKNWPYRREHVKRFIRDCGFCQKNTYTGYEVQIPRYVAGRYQPMERWAVDTIHLPKGNKDSEGNKFVVSVIDCFSRFLSLYAVPTLDSETVANVLLQHAGTFGIPSELVSDKGTGDFYNAVVREMLDRIGTNHFTSLAHSKEENSIVERSNKEVWRWLRALLYDKRIGHKNVTKALPFVQRIHNATAKEKRQYSPAQIIFGTRVELDRNILLTETQRNEPTATMTEWMADREKIQQAVIKSAKEQQVKTDRRNIMTRTQGDRENGNTEFPVDSFVLVSYPKTDFGDRRPNKITVMHHGPYQVTDRKGLEYTLRNLVSKKLITKSVFFLRPFHYDATRTDPTTVALTDYNHDFFVESILGHTGRWSRLTGANKITFTVKWEGYDETYNSEEPFSTLQWNDTFREYAIDKGYARILPKDED